ncbi:MAG: hypothetical protein KAT40_07540 [Bacteroidales bacterium]|nr:hypothetical protein [Bacteroidales bacterium]
MEKWKDGIMGRKNINGEFLRSSFNSLAVHDCSLAVQAGIIPTFQYSRITTYYPEKLR